MTTRDAATAALLGCIVFYLLAFGLRTVVQYRRTGASGFVGLSGAPGSAEWWGGILFAVAIVAGFVAPILQMTRDLVTYQSLQSAWVHALGILLYLAGLAGTLWAQFAMGDSWRIGVDAQARTTLVAAGPFRWVRNPIFTAMSVAAVGLTLLAPNHLSLSALGALLVALEIQVRLVEEPYLTRAHGDRYRRYAATAGRFLPGVGRLPEPR